MAVDIFELLGKVTVDIDGAKSDLQSIDKTAGSTSDAMERAFEEAEKASEDFEDALDKAEKGVDDLGDEAKSSKKQVGDFGDEIDKASDKAESSGNRIPSALKKIAGAVAVAFAVDKIVDFGTQLVNTAATVQAENAQFEATFKDMQGAAEKAFSSVAEETGIVFDRLQVEGTKAFSMFKGAGADANTALADTERFLNIAADAAAYYDISLEEASERVLGLAKGNFENGDAIGVFTNELQRNEAAMGKYGKNFSDLTEAQKQSLMLDIAEQTYEMSGAMGQASRESDGLENVMGNLKSEWKQFTAALGSPLLQAVIPILQNLTDVLGGFAENVTAFLDENGPAIDEFVSNVAEGIGSFIQTIVPPLMNMVQAILPVLLDYFTQWAPVLQQVAETLLPLFEQLVTTVMPILQELISAIMPALTEIITAFLPVLQPVVDIITMLFTNVIQPLVPLIQAIAEIVAGILSEAFTQIAGVFQQVAEKLQPILSKVGELITTVTSMLIPIIQTLADVFTTVLGGAIDAIVPIIEGLLDIFGGVIDFITGVFTGNWEQAWQGIVDTFKAIINLIPGFFEAVINAIIAVINGITSKLSGIWTWTGLPAIPQIPNVTLPRLAEGGVVDEPTTALIGEEGTEAVVPLENNTGWINRTAQKFAELTSGNVDTDIFQRVADALSDSTEQAKNDLEEIKALLLTIILRLTSIDEKGGNDIYLDGKTLVGQLIGEIDKALGTIYKRKGRLSV